MKKILLLLFFLGLFLKAMSFDNIVAHRDIVLKAMEILKYRYIEAGGNVNELNEFITGNVQTLITNGTYDEDNNDPMTNYYPVVLSHFWKADDGLDARSKLDCEPSDYLNAFTNARYYIGKINGSLYYSDPNKFYNYIGRFLHLFCDMGVPAHAHSEAHAGPDLANLCGLDDEYETNWQNHSTEYLSNYSSTKNYNNDGGFLYSTNNSSESDIMYFLFYTLNQMSDFHPSRWNPGNPNLPQGTNDVLTEKYNEWHWPVNDITTSPLGEPNPGFHSNLVQVHTTEFMVGACATILYYYLYQSGKLSTKIDIATLCADISNKDKNVVAPKAVILKPGFVFDSNIGHHLNVYTQACALKSSNSSVENMSIDKDWSVEPNFNDENKSSLNIKIYPNPSLGLINISFGNTIIFASVEIFNTKGSQIFSNIYSNTTKASINLTGSPKGIYVVKLNVEGKIYKQKISIE